MADAGPDVWTLVVVVGDGIEGVKDSLRGVMVELVLWALIAMEDLWWGAIVMV